jgi:NAD(P)-dependent dehydrogenase (short-subunit alcohol dehydrogenase family)
MLTGKVALVTGASKGIGAATVAALGRAQAGVIAHYGSDRDGARAATEGITARLVRADLAVPGAADDVWREAVAWRGHVDVVVLNAAVMLPSSIDADDERWDQCWQTSWTVNVTTHVRLMRAAVTHFRARGGGVLIALSSTAAHRGGFQPDLSAYAATKAALRAATQTIAGAYARDGILAHVIAPGAVDTRMTAQAAAAGPRIDSNAAESLMAPDEIARLIVWLAGGRGRALSGATIDVNGADYVR